MARINLLPWREERRQGLNKHFYTVLGVMGCLGLLAVFLVDLQINQQINLQKKRNLYIQEEQKILDVKISEIKNLKNERERLEERMGIIQNLQGNRAVVVRLFDEITRSVPDGVFLEKVERTGSKFKLEGVAEANNRISNLMRNLDNSDWFNGPNLTSVVADDKDGSNIFILTVNETATHFKKKGEGS